MSKSRTVRGTQRGDDDQQARREARFVVREHQNKQARREFKRSACPNKV